MYRKTSVVIAVLAAAGISAWLWLNPFGLNRAPEVTFSTLKGEKIAMRDLRGQPVLVTFWATTCSVCLKEMPHLIELYKEFGNRGFELIGVAMAYDPPNRVLELASERRLPYPIALDLDGSLASAFGGVTLTPTSFLIAPDGSITRHKAGETDLSGLRQQVEDLLSS